MNAKAVLWIIFLICLALDISFAFATWDDIRGTIGWVKHIPQKTSFKLRHIIQYSPQAFLLAVCLENTFKLNLKTRSSLTIILISLLGATTEIIQLYRPQRIFSFVDIFWNFTGACVGGGIYLCWKYARDEKKHND